MTDLITEARELCELRRKQKHIPMSMLDKMLELCDALEKAEVECEQMKTAISRYCRNDCYRDACTGNEDVGIPDCPMVKYAPPLPAPPEEGAEQ